MKKMIKLLFGVMLCVSAFLSTTAFARESGKCGDNLTWTLDNGVMTISGTGKMYDYDTAVGVPWYAHKEEIISLSIKGAENIGVYTFFGCTNLREVTLSESVKKIGGNAFCRCEALEEIIIPDSVELIDYKAFSYCINLKSIDLSDGLTDIGDEAFSYCSMLKNVNFPKNTANIGQSAFNECVSLETITFPDAVNMIGSGAFINCIALKKVRIPYIADSIISGSEFLGCTSLECVEMAEGVTNISTSMFAKCTALKSVVFADSVKVIKLSAFEDCTALENLKFNEGLLEIQSGAFENCTALSEVEFPSGIREIKSGAFRNCKSLTTVFIPHGTNTDAYAFVGCYNLKNINSDRFILNDDGLLYTSDGVSLSQVPKEYSGVCVIPYSVRNMAFEAFAGCTALEAVNIPPTHTNVLSGTMFSQCYKLKTISLPSDLIYIYADCFKDCKSLDCIYFAGNEQDWNNITIFENNENLINAPRYYNSVAITLIVNNQIAKCVRMPFVNNGVTMIPVRDIMEMLGAEVEYIAENHTVSIKLGENTMTASVGENRMNYNGNEFYSEISPCFVGGSIFVPLKTVAEQFGASVMWNDENKTVSVAY